MLIGRLFKHPLPQLLCVCVCVCILSVSLCITQDPALPEPLTLAQHPRTKSTSLFVYKRCCHDNCSTFDPHPHQTSVFRTCCVSVAPARCPGNAHTHTFQGRFKDSERLWNPSDPSMQSDRRARETLKASLFCHTHTYTHRLTHSLGSFSLFSILVVPLNVPVFTIVVQGLVACE